MLVSQSYNYIYTDTNYLNIILTLAVILFSFIGDIYASIIKRATSVKDSGHLLPGHGGFYDRFDSFIGVFFSFSLIGIFMRKINVVIYGSTGSIGNSTLSIIRQNKDKINIEGITCNKKYQKLKKIADEFNVKKIGISHDVKNKREYFKGRKNICRK